MPGLPRVSMQMKGWELIDRRQERRNLEMVRLPDLQWTQSLRQPSAGLRALDLVAQGCLCLGQVLAVAQRHRNQSRKYRIHPCRQEDLGQQPGHRSGKTPAERSQFASPKPSRACRLPVRWGCSEAD